MPKVHLTQTIVQRAETRDARYTIRDDSPGLILRVGAGSKVFYADYYDAGGRRVLRKLGSADVLTVAQAREAARELLARVALGEDITREKSGPGTLGEFLERHYFPWVEASRKSGRATTAILRSTFGFLWHTCVEDISISKIERWRVGKSKEIKATSINREVTSLKAALNWGVKRGLIKSHPLARLERLRELDSGKVRYLSPDERERLMAALVDDSKTNYLKPMVILALNTGIRRGSLFGLVWADIDLERRVMTLRAAEAKSGKVNHLPLNDAALQALREWREQSAGDGLVFPSPVSGGRLTHVSTAWERLLRDADITDFRWHDMRHDFASQLVMKGVDLNTVRELLGHADIKMTLRYAHLAPEAKARAVSVLDS